MAKAKRVERTRSRVKLTLKVDEARALRDVFEQTSADSLGRLGLLRLYEALDELFAGEAAAETEAWIQFTDEAWAKYPPPSVAVGDDADTVTW